MLKIVDYNPNDYSQNEVFKEQLSPNIFGHLVDMAFSLFFQWPEHRKAFFHRVTETDRVECEMDYDKSLKDIDDLYIAFKNLSTFKNGEMIRINFEIFGHCYCFDTLTVESYEYEGKFYIIFKAPDQLMRLNRRSFNRKHFQIEANVRVDFCDLNRNHIAVFRVTEISMTGLKLKESKLEQGFLKIKNEFIEVRKIREIDDVSVYVPILNTNQSHGHYFEFYAQYAYPGLISKENLTFEECIKTYADAGYFSTFAEERSSDYYEQIKKTWEAVKSAKFDNNVDYFVKKNEELIGCSSLVVAFKSEDEDFWSMHQLCSKKDPSWLDDTISLYAWRCDFLAYRKENLSAVGWFRGDSRWLERIYVTFIKNCSNDSVLKPIYYYRLNYRCEEKSYIKKIEEYQIGNTTRTIIKDKINHYGIGPEYLNANDHLNTVAFFEDTELSEIENIMSELTQNKKQNTMVKMIVSTVNEIHKYEEEGLRKNSNRYFNIKKDELSKFKDSIKQSLEITKRKYLKYGS